MTQTLKVKQPNRDPITGEPGSHPIGTTVGATTGILAGVAGAMGVGAATGSVVGPAGAIVGAAVGGLVGGLAGSAAGEDVNPTAEDAYWKENYKTREYVVKGADYDTYRPAYRYGVHAFVKHEGRDFDEIEPNLSQDWNSVREKSKLEWNDAKHATRDAYERLYTPETDDDM